MPESLFYKVARLRPATLQKKRLAQGFICELSEISKNVIFTKDLWTTAYVKKEDYFIATSNCLRKSENPNSREQIIDGAMKTLLCSPSPFIVTL